MALLVYRTLGLIVLAYQIQASLSILDESTAASGPTIFGIGKSNHICPPSSIAGISVDRCVHVRVGTPDAEQLRASWAAQMPHRCSPEGASDYHGYTIAFCLTRLIVRMAQLKDIHLLASPCLRYRHQRHPM